ncbi:MAG: 30S ribosomal protein S8 [Myxococcota bacterium]|nr:30S ribosomal protein S8 [Myxococcota bacterium]
MHTDPIADMLTRIRNAARANLSNVQMPASKMKVSIAEILKKEGFIMEFSLHSTKPVGILELTLKYDQTGAPVISGIERLSKPGLRKYFRAHEIPKVRNGMGVVIVSTSGGVVTDRDARSMSMGGEPLCSIW